MPMAQRQEMPMAQNKMADFIETENIAHFKTIVEMEADPAADTSATIATPAARAPTR
jgi:hypothetical protein